MSKLGSGKDIIKAFLGEETEFKGILKFDGAVRIDGKFEGNIESGDNLIVGESGHIIAEVRVSSIVIKGKVEGDVYAEQKVQITGKGQLIGNVYTPVLNIEDGAVLEGQISMTKDSSHNSKEDNGSAQASTPLDEPDNIVLESR
ncbi:MAG: bactofilin family protein [Nitrospinota bacterium]